MHAQHRWGHKEDAQFLLTVCHHGMKAQGIFVFEGGRRSLVGLGFRVQGVGFRV